MARLLCSTIFLALFFDSPHAFSDIREFPVPHPGGRYISTTMAADADGGVWWARQWGDSMYHATRQGKVIRFPLDTAPFWIYGVAVGADNAAWFTAWKSDNTAYIGRVALDGSTAVFQLKPGTFPGRIVAGPDGDLWFSEILPASTVPSRAGAIGRITTAGAISEFVLPSGAPLALAAGRDEAIWFLLNSADTLALGRITSDGIITTYPLSAHYADFPGQLFCDQSGTFWFEAENSLYSFTSGTGEHNEGTPPGWRFTVTPEGSSWFITWAPNLVRRQIGAGSSVTYQGFALSLSPAEQILNSVSTCPGCTENLSPTGITAAPDGSIWYTTFDGSRVGHLFAPLIDLVLNPLAIAPAAGQEFNTQANMALGSITDSESPDLSGVSIEVNWGDGTTSPGWLDRSSVQARHTYTNGGKNTITVSASDFAHDLQATATEEIMVASNPPSPAGIVTYDHPGFWKMAAGKQQVWFISSPGLGSLSPTGDFGAFGSAAQTLWSVTVTPDGSVWTTDRFDGIVYALNPGTGEQNTYAVSVHPNQITAGPDGAVWFTTLHSMPNGVPDNSVIGRIDAAGSFTTYPAPFLESGGITATAGTLWFTDADCTTIANMSLTGVTKTYETGHYSVPWWLCNGLAATADALWFANYDGPVSLARMTFDGKVTKYPLNAGAVNDIIAAPDGSIWYTDNMLNRIGRLDPTNGSVAVYQIGPNFEQPGIMEGITVGPDRNIWFTANNWFAGKNEVRKLVLAVQQITPGRPISVTEGQSFSATVATFTDTEPLPASDFLASIDWGDGISSTGLVTGSAPNFAVAGSHAYSDEGSFAITVHVHNSADQYSMAASTTAYVSDTPASLAALSIATQEGLAFNGPVGTLTFPGGSSIPGIACTVQWGDGAASACRLAGNAPNFSVNAAHTYALAGTYSLLIVAQEPGDSSLSAAGTAQVHDAPLSLTATTSTLRAGVLYPDILLGTLFDANPLATPAQYHIAVAWGDGTSSEATLRAGKILSSHKYLRPGRFTTSIMVTDVGGASARASGVISVTRLPRGRPPRYEPFRSQR